MLRDMKVPVFKHHAMETYGDRRNKQFRFLNLGIIWRWMVSFNHGETIPTGTHWEEEAVGPLGSQNAVAKRKTLVSAGHLTPVIQSQPVPLLSEMSGLKL